MSSFEVGFVGRASADQRAGRAGPRGLATATACTRAVCSNEFEPFAAPRSPRPRGRRAADEGNEDIQARRVLPISVLPNPSAAGAVRLLLNLEAP